MRTASSISVCRGGPNIGLISTIHLATFPMFRWKMPAVLQSTITITIEPETMIFRRRRSQREIERDGGELRGNRESRLSKDFVCKRASGNHDTHPVNSPMLENNGGQLTHCGKNRFESVESFPIKGNVRIYLGLLTASSPTDSMLTPIASRTKLSGGRPSLQHLKRSPAKLCRAEC